MLYDDDDNDDVDDDDVDEDDDDETLLKCLCIQLEANGGHCTIKLLIEYHINLS